MELLLLSLSVLTLTLSFLIAWILYQVSCQTAYLLKRVTAIQRVLNAFDRPETLAQSGVEVGQSWVPSAQEQARLSAQLENDSLQRAGSLRSKPVLRKRTGLPTVSSP